MDKIRVTFERTRYSSDYMGLIGFTLRKRLLAIVHILIEPKPEKGFKTIKPYYSIVGAFPFDPETGKVGFHCTLYHGHYYSMPFEYYDNEIREAWLTQSKSKAERSKK